MVVLFRPRVVTVVLFLFPLVEEEVIVVLPTLDLVETVTLAGFEPPVVLVIVLLPTFDLVVIRVPLFVLRIIMRAIVFPLLSTLP